MNKVRFKIPKFIKSALYNNYKYSIIVSGRRSGKTFNSVQWLCEMLLINPEKSAIWVDTTQSNVGKYMDLYFMKILQPINSLIKYNKQDKSIHFPNDSYIHMRSAERPENIEGFEYNYGVLNEAGIILKKDRLWNVTLLPMFKGKNTKVKVIGTPKGKNLFHNLYLRGKNNTNKTYKSFHYTSYDSPFYNNDELDKMKNEMPQEAYRESILAEFLDNSGTVFRNIKECIRKPKKDLRVDIMSIDLAKHQDFTVITMLNKQNRQVVDIDRFNKIDWNFQKTRIYNLWKLHKKPQVIIDSTGAGDPIFDDLKSVGMNIQGYKFTNESKKQLIQTLSVSMDNKEIFFPNNEILISELSAFGYDVTSSGKIRYNAPSGLHDDCVISLSLANWLIKESKVFNFLSNY